jgi:alanyl-tRNA synthetase
MGHPGRRGSGGGARSSWTPLRMAPHFRCRRETSCRTEGRATSASIPPAPDGEYGRLMTQERERSPTATVGIFKGGLAEQPEATIRLHTAVRLLYKTLRRALSDYLVQRGSNVTGERLRFDSCTRAKMTQEQPGKVEAIVNQNITQDWPMVVVETTPDEAFANGSLKPRGQVWQDRHGVRSR